MQCVMEFFRTDGYFLVLNFIIIFLFVGFIVLFSSNLKMKKKYNNFIRKLGNGKDLEEDLENFMYKVDRVERQNLEINNFCDSLQENLSKCIQKIGVVRYSAFKNTGSDLSFAVALLNENNDGIIFNGIYSREMSNIYAKPVHNGNSKYTLSKEEIESLEIAMNSKCTKV